MPLAKSDLYRLPWSLTDNPIGWLEITDICNLYCKGCYRQNLEGHKTFDQIKEEIDLLADVRNCDNISIAGGEPLVHPQILDIIRYIRGKGLKAIMLTNGKAMTEQRMRDLQAADLTGITFHIDQMQERKRWEDKNELELMELRQSFVDMARRIGGRKLHMSFGSTVYNENFQYLPRIVEWARANSDIVDGLVMITFRAVPESDDVSYSAGGEKRQADEIIYSSAALDEINIKSYDVWNKLHDEFGEWESCAYLDGTHDHHSIKWLITGNVLFNRQSIGFVGARGMEFAQQRHHWKHGRYFAYEFSNAMSKIVLGFGALIDKGMRRAFFRSLARMWNPLNWFRKPRVLSIGVVQAPDLLPNGECDMCDDCPDMTVYKGRLYRSCRLDEVRKFGEFLKPEFQAATPGRPATTVPASTPAVTASRQ